MVYIVVEIHPHQIPLNPPFLKGEVPLPLFIIIQAKGAMEDGDGKLRIFRLYNTGYLDFGSADHQDIDAFLSQDGEHPGRNARMADHAHADDGYFGHILIYLQPVSPDLLYDRLDYPAGLFNIF